MVDASTFAVSPNTQGVVTQMEENTTKSLSPRQQMVYDLHHQGVSNKEIAVQLGIAPGTVSNALQEALRRMGEKDAPTMGDMSLTQFMNHRLAKLVGDRTRLEESLTQVNDEMVEVVTGATTIGVALDPELVNVAIGMGDIDAAPSGDDDTQVGDE